MSLFRRSGVAPSLLILFTLVALSVEAQRPQTSVVQRPRRAEVVAAPSNPGARVALDCQVYCSRANPGVSVAEVTWKAADVSLGPELLEARLGQQGLDTTVYKDGFSRGVYARLLPVLRTQRFLMQSSTLKDARQQQRRTPGLDRLTVTAIRPVSERSRAERAEALDPGKSKDERTALVGVQVEGLEPGLNYFWRVVIEVQGRRETSEVIRCQAPTCPVDQRLSPKP